MRALRTLLAVALVAAAPVAVAGCGGKSAEEQAAEKANDTVPATSIQDRNAALDARDEKSAKILEREQQKGVGAVKEAKEVVDGAIDDTVGTATAEAKARAERAQDGAKDAADAAILDARREAEKARSNAEKVLGDVAENLDRTRSDIEDVQDDIASQVPTTEDEESVGGIGN